MVIRLFVITLFSLLAGCGGGNGGAAAVPTATTRVIVTTTLRTLKQGDFISYNLSGTTTAGGVTSVLAGTSKFFYTLQSPSDPLGNTHSSETRTSNLTSNGVPVQTSATVNYFSQQGNGTFLFWGDNSSLWVTSIAGNVVRFRSPFVVGDTWQQTYFQQSGEKINETITVNARVTITVPLGTFETFKVTMVQDRQIKANANAPYQTFETITTVDYIVPSIGIIKETIVSSRVIPPVSTTNALVEMVTSNIAF